MEGRRQVISPEEEEEPQQRFRGVGAGLSIVTPVRTGLVQDLRNSIEGTLRSLSSLADEEEEIQRDIRQTETMRRFGYAEFPGTVEQAERIEQDEEATRRADMESAVNVDEALARARVSGGVVQLDEDAAQRYVRGRFLQYQEQWESGALPRPEIPEVSERYLADLQDDCEEIMDEVIALLREEGNLPPEILRSLSETPPTIIVAPPGFFEGSAQEDGMLCIGSYTVHSNVIIINPSPPRPRSWLYGEGAPQIIQQLLPLTAIISHELHHYISYLGGGRLNFRFRDQSGEEVSMGHIRWLNEGITEYLSQRLNPGTPYVAYPLGTSIAGYLRCLLDHVPSGEVRRPGQPSGEVILRRAYLNGDFTQVREIIDRLLGAGTFRELVQLPNCRRAWRFLTRRMEERGIDRRRMRDPVLDDIRALPIAGQWRLIEGEE